MLSTSKRATLKPDELSDAHGAEMAFRFSSNQDHLRHSCSYGLRLELPKG